MLRGCWLFFLIPKIETGLSVSLRLLPGEFELASCLHFHLPVIYCMSYTYDLYSYRYVTQMLPCLFLASSSSSSSDHRRLALAHGVVCRSDSKVCRLAPVCQRQRSAALAESASQSSRFHTDLKGYYDAWRKRTILLSCTVFHHREHSPASDSVSARSRDWQIMKVWTNMIW